VTRVLKRLAGAGWITTWDEPVSGGGGSRRWAIPTTKALHWGASTLRRAVRGCPWEPIANRMLPGERAHPLQLVRGKLPAFLAHQREVNKLCIRFRHAFGKNLRWVSAFDRPFPATIGGIGMPQPDFVLALETEQGVELIFGEHDRGSESLAHFRRAKAERYAELASLPRFCLETFGFARFRVLVVVMDVVRQKPRARLARLEACTREVWNSADLTFHLAGKVHHSPSEWASPAA
jgi:hypothetical protein